MRAKAIKLSGLHLQSFVFSAVAFALAVLKSLARITSGRNSWFFFYFFWFDNRVNNKHNPKNNEQNNKNICNHFFPPAKKVKISVQFFCFLLCKPAKNFFSDRYFLGLGNFWNLQFFFKNFSKNAFIYFNFFYPFQHTDFFWKVHTGT